jgi:hypothetical protein
MTAFPQGGSRFTDPPMVLDLGDAGGNEERLPPGMAS